jgi:hypothetical protein
MLPRISASEDHHARAHLVSIHWTGPTSHPLTADKATQLCFDEARIELLRTKINASFRLDGGRFPTQNETLPERNAGVKA